jgi:hypothetical protein
VGDDATPGAVSMCRPALTRSVVRLSPGSPFARIPAAGLGPLTYARVNHDGVWARSTVFAGSEPSTASRGDAWLAVIARINKLRQ